MCVQVLGHDKQKRIHRPEKLIQDWQSIPVMKLMKFLKTCSNNVDPCVGNNVLNLCKHEIKIKYYYNLFFSLV